PRRRTGRGSSSDPTCSIATEKTYSHVFFLVRLTKPFPRKGTISAGTRRQRRDEPSWGLSHFVDKNCRPPGQPMVARPREAIQRMSYRAFFIVVLEEMLLGQGTAGGTRTRKKMEVWPNDSCRSDSPVDHGCPFVSRRGLKKVARQSATFDEGRRIPLRR